VIFFQCPVRPKQIGKNFDAVMAAFVSRDLQELLASVMPLSLCNWPQYCPGDNFDKGKRRVLLCFNGISASIELVASFLEALVGPEAIIFDVPGLRGSPAPTAPYRPRTLG